eukprot:TRINITY_DN11576_c0_g1_i1.p1 TRINITY_DN11576_c0_g1~~TRINITY_DN11576_c0_g1_i1.p1  ORF type:complete len:198 (-),score=57.69 TRINITY_DN11576_c0_g1_i1:59-652(-)
MSSTRILSAARRSPATLVRGAVPVACLRTSGVPATKEQSSRRNSPQMHRDNDSHLADLFFDDFFDASRGINRLFGRFKNELESFEKTKGSFLGSADLVEDDKALKVTIDVPGFKKENIKVTLEDQVLSVEGVREKETLHEDNARTHSERSYGKFERRFRLPRGIDEESMKADLKNGVLNITVQKVEGKSHGRDIEIH